MKPKLAVFGAGGLHLPSLLKAHEQLITRHGPVLDLAVRSAEDLSDRNEADMFIELAGAADLLILLLHGGRASCPVFDRLIEAATGARIYIHPEDEEELELSRLHSTDFGGDVFQETMLYMKYGGPDNWENLLKKLVKNAGGPDLPADPPKPRPCEGLYHPRFGAAGDLTAYFDLMGLDMEEIIRGVKPVIGLWFLQYYYLESNLETMDAIISEIEDRGGVPLACFYRRYPDPRLVRKNTFQVVENFFQYKGKTIIDCLINTIMFSLALTRPGEAEALSRLDVPILQAMNLSVSRKFWRESAQGLSPMDVSLSAAQPEFDGILITVPMAARETGQKDKLTGASISKSLPIPERINKIVRLAFKWAGLRKKPNREKKAAIIFHNYPPRNDKIGCARGLDSFASVVDLLQRLKKEGYYLEKGIDSPQELADLLVGGLTNDSKWLPPEKMAEKAADTVGPEKCDALHRSLPPKNQAHQEKDWGRCPGELFVHEGQVLINGFINGNIYLGVQPPRGRLEQPEKIHDPYLSPSHHYLIYYRWLRDVFQADAVLHIGKHGSLEWLPGKSAGLGPECYPDLAIMDLPNIYPYIINDPGEGTQAKRRSYCCLLDHLIPVMTNADKYEELAEVDKEILQYMETEAMNPKRAGLSQNKIWEAVEARNLHFDLETDRETAFRDFPAFLEKLHAYISEVADTAIDDGLHIFGRPPENERLVELAVQLVRIKNGNLPSLRETLAESWGYDYDALLDRRGQADPSGRHPTYALALEAVHQEARRITAAILADRDPGIPEDNPDLQAIADFIKEVLAPRIDRTRDEMEAAVAALEGRYVKPGPSGSPTRGMVEILPTGRNFYSVDPFKIPSPAAWEVGMRLGDDLVDRIIEETGLPPDNIGLVLWGGPTMRNQGEDVAEALYLMGLAPVWNPKNGRVVDLAVTALEDLKFPRVDITFRASGFFRDSFPNLMQLLDRAARLAAMLDEPVESNFLRRNVIREIEVLAKQGLGPEEALREASFRIFSDPPGAYGTGVPETIDAGTWKTDNDLGDVFTTYGGYAYGRDVYGLDKKENFKRRLKDINFVIKNEDSREYDLLSSDDFNAYFGGFIAAVKAASGVFPRAFSGDASDPERIKSRSLKQEARHVFRSRILNPKWMEGLMKHGYKGAGDLSRTVDTAFHWDATSQVMDDWMYQGLAEKYALNQAMQEWFKKVNPHALMNITERLLEAVGRGMWEADPETKKQLEKTFLEIEGDIEELSL